MQEQSERYLSTHKRLQFLQSTFTVIEKEKYYRVTFISVEILQITLPPYLAKYLVEEQNVNLSEPYLG